MDVDIVFFEDGKLVEFYNQKINENFFVGDIFLGWIKCLMLGLNVVFVDIGYKKDVFLYYMDFGLKLQLLLKYIDGLINGNINMYWLENFEFEFEIIKIGKIDKVFVKK